MTVRRRHPKVPVAQAVAGKPVCHPLPTELMETGGNSSTRQKRYTNRKPLKQVYYRSTEAERNRPVQQRLAVRGHSAGDAQVVSARDRKSANKSLAAGKIGDRVELLPKMATGSSSIGQLGHRKQYSSHYDDSSDSETEPDGNYNRHSNKRTERKNRDSSKENAREGRVYTKHRDVRRKTFFKFR